MKQPSPAVSPHLPATRAELRGRGWDRCDVVLVTGDAHVDHPSFPAALLGRWLEAHGFRVGVIARPDPASDDLARLGLPRLCFGVTAGALDSMVANYTAQRRRRSDDPYAPGGRAGGRPDRAVTVYGNAIRRSFGPAAFVVAGGLEASLRRFSHYDFWDDAVRRPLLMDGAVDVLVHGMGEGPLLEIVRRLDALERAGELRASGPGDRSRDPRLAAVRDVPGVVYRVPASTPPPADAVELPSCEAVQGDAATHARGWALFERTRERRQWQLCAGMRVVVNPPWPAPSPAELDRLYALPFSRDVHPVHRGARVPALEQVRFSVTAHRGCCGGCAFCAITAHQGRRVASRSAESIVAEVERIAAHPEFRGTVPDVGGPTANLWGASCGRDGACGRVSCLWPERCPELRVDQERWLRLLRRARRVPGVRHLFVTTGVRLDLALESEPVMRALAGELTSGHLKVAPEHVVPHVLGLMRKPAGDGFGAFVDRHDRLARAAGRRQQVVPYLMAAHPGARLEDAVELALFLRRRSLRVEQVQIFTPTPGTASTVMYATGLDPATVRPVFVERDARGKELQKALLLWHLPESAPRIREALRKCGRTEALAELLGDVARRAPKQGLVRSSRRRSRRPAADWGRRESRGSAGVGARWARSSAT